MYHFSNTCNTVTLLIQHFIKKAPIRGEYPAQQQHTPAAAVAYFGKNPHVNLHNGQLT